MTNLSQTSPENEKHLNSKTNQLQVLLEPLPHILCHHLGSPSPNAPPHNHHVGEGLAH